jgi:hypothetical protein
MFGDLKGLLDTVKRRRVAALPAARSDPWYEAGRLLRQLVDRNLLDTGIDCWRLLLERTEKGQRAYPQEKEPA